MKYKVGDKVRVRTLDDLRDSYSYNFDEEALDVNGVYFTEKMQDYCGRIVTISETFKFGGRSRYSIEGCRLIWTDDMFEEFKVQKTIDNMIKRMESMVDELNEEVEGKMGKDKEYYNKIVKIEERINIYKEKSGFNKIEEVVPKKVVNVEFVSGYKCKMVCDKEDEFSMGKALYIAYAKLLYSDIYTSEGIEKRAEDMMYEKRSVYKISNAMKLIKAQKELEEEIKKHEELLEHRRQKRWDKKQKQIERRAKKQKELEDAEKERQIEIQKEAILRANREMKANEQ